MKFIQHIPAQATSHFLYKANGETIRGNNEIVEIQNEEALAELKALRKKHGPSLELKNNISNTLAGSNALLNEVIADLIKQGLNPNMILQTNLNLEGNTIRFGAAGPVEDPLSKIRPIHRPDNLVTEPAIVTKSEPETVAKEEAVESAAKVPSTPKSRAEAVINAMNPLNSVEAKITGAGLLKALQGLGLSVIERNAVNLLLKPEFDTNKFWKGDKVSLNKPKNGSLEIRITRGGKDLGTFTFPEKKGSAIQLGSKIEIASSH